MRMRINRLVYVFIGAALAVGLLVSAFVRPEPTLIASGDCYGLCPSVTAPGSYKIVAHYSRNKNSKPSTLSRKTLLVLMH